MDIDRRRFVAVFAATLAVGPSMRLGERSASTPIAPPPPASPPPAQVASAPRPALLDEALAALDRHSARVALHDRIALVDFAQPSSEARMQLVNIESGEIEESWLVAHGNGSDPAATGMLHRFSNEMGSNATSRGAYRVADVYYGKHGRSQRVLGLDASNDQALVRAIVIHGADYVRPDLIASQGRIGRSQGCFAVEQSCIDPVIARLGTGRMIYAGRSA